MKYLVLVLILLLAPMAFADTTTTSWNTDCDHLNEFLNEEAQHSHGLPDAEDAMGVGIDVKCFETKDQKVNIGVQDRYDFENQVNAAYIVLGVDLTKFKKGE